MEFGAQQRDLSRPAGRRFWGSLIRLPFALFAVQKLPRYHSSVYHNRNIKQGYIPLSLHALQGASPLTPVGLFLPADTDKKSPQTTGKKMTAEKRTKQLIIRVSPTEFETLTRQKTHPSLARYIREQVLESGKTSDKKTAKFQFPPEVVRVLAGMGNNLNQIAKTLNTAAKIGTLGNVEAVQAAAELAALERALNSLRDFLAKEKTGGQPQ